MSSSLALKYQTGRIGVIWENTLAYLCSVGHREKSFKTMTPSKIFANNGPIEKIILIENYFFLEKNILKFSVHWLNENDHIMKKYYIV